MDIPPRDSSNLPDYRVSEIAGAIKRTLEAAFGRVRVRGEITELKRYPSGHVYLSLKDEDAKLEAVIWKSALRNIGIAPENGVEVIATGRITTYADRSKYQLSIERLDYAGAGALLARIEKLRVALAAEGLFDESRKVALPLLPRVIGVVTSEKGAVIQDIRTTLLRRFPSRILLWPVAVQGAGAAEQVAAAIRGFDALPPDGPVPRPDVLIVARGGGSLEDLMAFNEEIVVRAAAACRIPLISAVGHETDTTLIDFAADRRAPTPTAAAEIAVPARIDLQARLDQIAARLNGLAGAVLDQSRLRLVRAERRLPDLPGMLAAARQRLDDRGERLDQAPSVWIDRRRAALERVGGRLPHPREVIAGHRATLRLLAQRAEAGFARQRQALGTHRVLLRFDALPMADRLAARRAALTGLAARLEAVSYAAVLARGFALVRDAAGGPVTAAAQVAPGAKLGLTFADGTVGVTAEGRRGKGAAPPEQGALL
jgi:exodeoxyribonuclease VII large subunit